MNVGQQVHLEPTETDLERTLAERVPELRLCCPCERRKSRCYACTQVDGRSPVRHPAVCTRCHGVGYTPDCTTDKLMAELSKRLKKWSLDYCTCTLCVGLYHSVYAVDVRTDGDGIPGDTPRMALMLALEQLTRPEEVS